MKSITNLESLTSEKTGEEFVRLKRSLGEVGILNMLRIAAEKRLCFSPSQVWKRCEVQRYNFDVGELQIRCYKGFINNEVSQTSTGNIIFSKNSEAFLTSLSWTELI